MGTCVLAAGIGLSSCGGGSHNSNSASSGGSVLPVQVSSVSTLPSNCGSAQPSTSTETFTAGSGVQPEAAAIPAGNVVALWEQDRWSGLGARAILASHSADNGATWSSPLVLPFGVCGNAALTTYDRTSDPSISFAGNGVLVASALAFSASGYVAVTGFTGSAGTSAVLLSRSTDGGLTWSTPPMTIKSDSYSAGATGFFNDRDSVTADPATGNVYVAWDRLSSLTNASLTGGSVPAYLALLPNGAASTSGMSQGVLYDPGTGFEAFNNQILVLPSGKVVDIFTLLDSAGNSSIQALQVGAFNATAGTWSTSNVVFVVQNYVSNGTPNQTPAGTPSIRDSRFIQQSAVDPATGTIAVVWQQASNGSTTFDGIALSTSTDGGLTWSTPKQINGSTAVPAFNPSVRYLPGSVLAVTYYDLRDYASGSSVLNTDVWLTESSDTTTWHEVRLQAPFDLTQAPQTDTLNAFGTTTSFFLGDNQGLAAVGSNPVPVYSATNSSGAHVYAIQPPNPLNAAGAHVYTAP